MVGSSTENKDTRKASGFAYNKTKVDTAAAASPTRLSELRLCEFGVLGDCLQTMLLVTEHGVQEAADALRAAEEAAARASAQPEEVFEANDFSYENLLRLDYNRNRRGEGLELTKLLRLKTVVCRTGGSCSICLEDFEGECVLVRLPCRHSFHEQCPSTRAGCLSRPRRRH